VTVSAPARATRSPRRRPSSTKWRRAAAVKAARRLPEPLPRVPTTTVARRALATVVGTETLGRLSDLARIVALLGAGQVVGSLDLRGDVLLCPAVDLAGCTSEQAVGLLARQGIQEMLVLDLARVGTRSGPVLAAWLIRPVPQGFEPSTPMFRSRRVP